jgi:hypothetical protein
MRPLTDTVRQSLRPVYGSPSRLSRLPAALRLHATHPSSVNAARLILLALTWPCVVTLLLSAALPERVCTRLIPVVPRLLDLSSSPSLGPPRALRHAHRTVCTQLVPAVPTARLINLIFSSAGGSLPATHRLCSSHIWPNIPLPKTKPRCRSMPPCPQTERPCSASASASACADHALSSPVSSKFNSKEPANIWRRYPYYYPAEPGKVPPKKTPWKSPAYIVAGAVATVLGISILKSIIAPSSNAHATSSPSSGYQNPQSHSNPARGLV